MRTSGAVHLGSARVGALEALARQSRIRLPGVRRDDLAETVDHGLTPRESEVLRLLVTGATKRAQAAATWGCCERPRRHSPGSDLTIPLAIPLTGALDASTVKR